MAAEETLAYNFNISEPPLTLDCLGLDCQFKTPGEPACELTTHHVIHPRTRILATKNKKWIDLRRAVPSRIKMHQCRHLDEHDYPFAGGSNAHAKRLIADLASHPREIVDGYLKEARDIEELGIAVLHFTNLEFEITADEEEATDQEIEVYIRERAVFQAKRGELVSRITESRILSPAIVTGSLLVLAPEEAEKRLEVDPRYAMPDLSEGVLLTIERRREKETGRRAA